MNKLTPIPTIKHELKKTDGKKFVLSYVHSGKVSPYFYIGDKQRLAFVRIENEPFVADSFQIKTLVLKGSGRTYDSLPFS